MGNINQTNKQLYTPQQNIPYIINHPILQNSQIIISKNILKTTIVQQSQLSIKNWKKKIQEFNLINHDFLMLPLSVTISQQGLCGNTCSISLLFKCYPYVLMDQILSRKSNSKQFQQDQMWYVIWALADASKKMISKGTKLGDIRPHNILFNETGDVKITNLISWPNQLSNFQKTYYEKTKTYLSPEQLYCMTTGTKSDTTNLQLSQSFSIGLTLLSMLCYQDLSVLYQNDISFYGININKLKQKCQSLNKLNYHSSYFKKRVPYSQGLVDLVKKLCCQDFQQRVNILDIWNWLKPFQQDILSFKPFQLPRQISGIIISPTKTTIIPNQTPIFIGNNSLPVTRLSTPMKIPISINYEQNQHSPSSLKFPYQHQTQYPIFIPGSTSPVQYNPPILSTHLPNQQIYFQNSHPIISPVHNYRKEEVPILQQQKIKSNEKQSFNNSKSSVQNFAFSQSYQQKSHARLQKLNNNKHYEQFSNQKHNIKDIAGQKSYTLGQQQDIIDIVDRQLSKSKRLFPSTPTK